MTPSSDHISTETQHSPTPNPLISVIIPTRNGEKTVLTALQSVYTQTYRNLEVIIVIDHPISPLSEQQAYESLKHVITAYIEQSKIEYTSNKTIPTHIVQGKGTGPGTARNLAVTHAKGEWVAFLDDDDIWTDAEKLQKQVTYVSHHPTIKVTSVEHIIHIDETGNTLRHIRQVIDPKICHFTMLLRNPMTTSGTLCSKQVYVELGGMPQQFVAEDYALWLAIGKKYPYSLSNTPNTSVTYTIRSGGLSKSKALRMSLTVMGLIMKYRHAYPQSWKAMTKGILRIARSLIS